MKLPVTRGTVCEDPVNPITIVFTFEQDAATNAELLIVNHAMFFSDLVRRQNVSLLPDYDAVILDECHTLESVAGDHLGMRMTSGQFDYLFDRLYNDRTHKGLLVEKELVALQQMVDRCRYASSQFFADLLIGGNQDVPTAE